MLEPDVTLTDFALALECAVFCVLVWRRSPVDGGGAALRRWWTVFFASIGIAALIGGIVHGFVADDGSPAGRVLWVTTLLMLGVTSVAAWHLGSWLLPTGPWLRWLATVMFVVYAAVVLFVTQRFVVAIAMYLPATVFLLVTLILRYRRAPSRPLLVGIGGLLLTFMAAAVQQLGIALHPVYFNHNALYHLLQFVALWMLFRVASAAPETPH